jgi:hypothetical protein
MRKGDGEDLGKAQLHILASKLHAKNKNEGIV